MSISPNRIPRKFVEAVQEKKRKENQEKAAKDTKAIRQSFGKNGDKMDYQSSKEAQAKAKKPTETVKKGQDVISDDMSFGKAFRAARNEGMKTFTWRGKKYGTKLKSEVKKKESTPKAKASPETQLRPQLSLAERSRSEVSANADKLSEIEKSASELKKPRVVSRRSQIERVNKAIDKINEALNYMRYNPDKYFGIKRSSKQLDEMNKLLSRKEMLQKKLKNMS